MFLPEKAIIEFILLNVTRFLEKFPNSIAPGLPSSAM
jgi:hypothetical protein